MKTSRARRPHAAALILSLIALALAPAVSEASEGVCSLPADQGTTTEPAELCGTTTIRGSKPASIEVNLSDPATVATPFGSSPDLDIAGEGRFVSFVLVGTGSSTSGVALLGERFPAEGGYEILMPVSPVTSPISGSYVEVKTFPDSISIPAGSYRLYLLPDGSEITVTLHLGGLAGSTDLRPTGPADYRTFSPEPSSTGGGGLTNNLYGAGETETLAGDGLLFQAFWQDIEVLGAEQYQQCYAPDPDIDPSDAGPACAPISEKSTFVQHRFPVATPHTRLYAAGIQVPAGRQHLGFWNATEAVVNAVDYVQFWLAY